MKEQPLLTPVRLGPYRLRNRIVMAPMTRARADNRDRVPTALMADYYGQRASAGLIVTEATQVSPQGVGYLNTPGIHSQAQIAGWRRVTDVVHRGGGRVFAQLWHVGRISHPDFIGGDLPVAPSAVRPEGQAMTVSGMKDFVTPRSLATHEVRSIVADFGQAAKNAIVAGFDGVEIHGANGYLVEQFLRDSTNLRSDAYGGSIRNRGRLLFEIVEEVGETIGSERVGVRLSPANVTNIAPDSDTAALYDFAIGVLDGYGLAYLHLREAADGVPDIPNMVPDVTARYRTVWRGTLITNTGFDREKANTAIAEGQADLVAFGVPYIANPDLVERFRRGEALAEADPSTFYQGSAKGYIDYSPLRAEAA